jgi:hypothetical protein
MPYPPLSETVVHVVPFVLVAMLLPVVMATNLSPPCATDTQSPVPIVLVVHVVPFVLLAAIFAPPTATQIDVLHATSITFEREIVLGVQVTPSGEVVALVADIAMNLSTNHSTDE